jgi:hypothetical protein
MGIALINTITVKNISKQVVPIDIKRYIGSIIFSKYGNIQLAPERTVEAEEERFLLSQLRQLASAKVIEYSHGKRAIDTGTGTTGSSSE